MADDVTSQPSAAVSEVLDFAVSFASLARDGKSYRIRRSTSDLMHTMGYFCAQARTADPKERLVVIAESLRYLSDRLTR